MITYSYPTQFEFKGFIEPDYIARQLAGRVGLDIMPILDVFAAEVRWAQKDNAYGLQGFRGLDGAPSRVTRRGDKMYAYDPGVFGEFYSLTETELTRRAGYSPDGSVIDISDMVADGDELLVGREADRMESSIWSVLQGILTILIDGPNGLQTGYTDTYSVQTYSAITPWTSFSSATPIRDFQSVQQLQVGRSVDFSAGATAYGNRQTVNELINNSNASDLGGRRYAGGATLNNLDDMSSYMVAQMCPMIRCYDEGYHKTLGGIGTSDFTKFIPNNLMIVVGKRTSGVSIGRYHRTRNMVLGGAPGSYRLIKNTFTGENAPKMIPPTIEGHRGHNGGPTLEYPSAVALMHV
jgi:hypothetical protein